MTIAPSAHMQAVVIANGLNGYGAVRSLAHAGINSIVIAPSHSDLSALSRLPSRCDVLPMGNDWESQLMELLARLELTERTPLLACSDRAAAFLQRYRDELEDRYALLIPEGDVIQTLNDKRTELELMQENGIPIPASVTRIESLSSDVLSLTLPVIVKPRTYEGYAVISAKNLILRTREQWVEFRTTYWPLLEHFVVQEVIPGDDSNLWVCNATFDKNHRIARFFSFRRLGTSPSHYGVTSLAVSESNPALRQLVQRIGGALRYAGPVMMEFKYDLRSGQYLYIEANPRLGMCNWFGTACGVNNVEATCALGLGNVLERSMEQQDGVIFVHAVADFVSRLEDRERLARILRRYMRLLFARKSWAVFDPSDLQPFVQSSATAFKMLTARVIRRLGRGLGIGAD